MPIPLHADVSPPLRVDEFAALQGAIAQATDRAAEARPEVTSRAAGEPLATVTIGVSGGAPSERYVFMVKLDADGEGEFWFLDEVARREEQRGGFNVSQKDAAWIFRLLHPLVEPGPRQFYEPDSLVGYVTVRAGRLETQQVFPVWEAEAGDAVDHLMALPGVDNSLWVDPQQVPEGLTDLFAEMSRLVTQDV